MDIAQVLSGLHLIPDEYRRSVRSIDLQSMRCRGYYGLILDLDNTLVAWGSEDEPGEPIQMIVREAESLGFQVCLVSNNFSDRVQRMSDSLGVPGIPGAQKPRRRAFRKALQLIEVPRHKTVMVGDQLFTDVFGANRMGLYTILVQPINQHEFWWTRWVRRLEARLLQSLQAADRLSLIDTYEADGCEADELQPGTGDGPA